jgi:hypothetical protein
MYKQKTIYKTGIGHLDQHVEDAAGLREWRESYVTAFNRAFATLLGKFFMMDETATVRINEFVTTFGGYIRLYCPEFKTEPMRTTDLNSETTCAINNRVLNRLYGPACWTFWRTRELLSQDADQK